MTESLNLEKKEHLLTKKGTLTENNEHFQKITSFLYFLCTQSLQMSGVRALLTFMKIKDF